LVAGRKIFKGIIVSVNRGTHAVLAGGEAVATQKTRSRGSGFFAFRYLNPASPNLI